MFSKIKKTIFTSQFYVFMLLGSSVLINACQEQESAQPQLEEVQYEMYDDVFVTVLLDPNKVHEFHSFASLEAHDAYLISMEESGEKVVVNKKMWEDLSHYFDPYILSVMDMNYEIEVEGDLYKANREEILKKPAGSDQWEKYIFYGLSGKVDLEETTLVYTHLESLEDLKDYTFKSASSKEIYLEKVDHQKQHENGRILTHQGTDNWVVPQYPNGPAKDFTYRKSAGTSGTLYHSNIRIFAWNHKYTQWGKKAKGATHIQIKRITEGQTSFTTVASGQTIGGYHENGLPDNTVPYTYVRVEAKGGGNQSTGNVWWVEKGDVNRNSDWVISYHRAEIRENNGLGNAPRYDCYKDREASNPYLDEINEDLKDASGNPIPRLYLP